MEYGRLINPPKNWRLNHILKSTDNCDNCGRPIVWCYYIYQDGIEHVVGSECVKAISDIKDPNLAKTALVGNWQQKRAYYYKRIKGHTWFIGQHTNGKWWVAMRESADCEWQFANNNFTNIDSAKLAILRHINDS